jgi:6-phosphogluconolactonase/glucosamine-6-phosphate isomerase/deaminase
VAGHVVDVQPSENVEPNVARITLTPRFFTLATDVLVLAVGSNKARLVARAFEGARQPADLPAQLLVRPNATWLLDEAAASQLAT